MINQSEKLNLSGALALFEDHLDDISDSLAENLTDRLENLEPWPKTDDENLIWVLNGIRKLEIEQITAIPLKVIRRIQSLKYYTSVEAHQDVDRITDEDKLRAKEVPIEELYDGQLNKAGRKLWGICPWHQELTASFCIHEDNRWSCFGACNEHGDSIDYIMKRDGVDFIKAIRQLINK